MLVIVKNGIDTPEGKRGVQLARDMAADLLLIQNSVYFVRAGWLGDFSGKVYVLDEDLGLRGLNVSEIAEDIIKVGYDTLVDLITESDKVVGML